MKGIDSCMQLSSHKLHHNLEYEGTYKYNRNGMSRQDKLERLRERKWGFKDIISRIPIRERKSCVNNLHPKNFLELPSKHKNLSFLEAGHVTVHEVQFQQQISYFFCIFLHCIQNNGVKNKTTKYITYINLLN